MGGARRREDRVGLGSSWGGQGGEKRRQAQGFSNSGRRGLPGAPLADISQPPMEETHIHLWRFHPHHL